MKSKRLYLVAVLMICLVLILCACGKKSAVVDTPAATPAGSTAAISQTDPKQVDIPVTIEPAATPEPEATPEPTPEPSPEPTPAPAPAETPVPSSPPGAPVITKSPTDETVEEGGTCYFAAGYIDALTAEWHFVSPDLQTDLPYTEIGTQFPTLVVKNGEFSQMKLQNIPLSLNGWHVYCRYVNKNGVSYTKSATVYVTENTSGTANTAAPADTANLPVVTKSPTDETVTEGGECWFVAKHEKAILAVWHFVSPDGQTDIAYDAAAEQFKPVVIENGDRGAMHLKNIPVSMNGWKVYCRYSNNSGSVDTKTATLTVKAK